MASRALVVGIDGRELGGRPTGTGRYLRNLLRYWRETDDTLVLYFNGPPPADPILDHPRIRLRAIGTGTRGLLFQQRLLPLRVREDRVDVFFSPAYSCPLALDAPRVTAVHDLSFFSYPHDFALLDGLRRRLLVASSVRVSRFVLVCSDFSRREFERLFPDLAPRARCIPLAAAEELPPSPSRIEARARLDLAGPLLLTVGAVLNRRCLPELLRAAARLRRLHPRLVLDVVGENRTHRPLDLPALVSRLGLDAHVRLSGFVDEAALVERYAAADVAVFLSEYEGFGLPALEAAAHGVPLVASRAPSLGEVFDTVAALVNPRDEVAVAATIDQLLRDPQSAAARACAGRALASRFSWAATAHATRELLAMAARS